MSLTTSPYSCSESRQWSWTRSICSCSPPHVPACPSHLAWGTLLLPASIHAGDIRSLAPSHRVPNSPLPINAATNGCVAASWSHPCPIETDSSWLIPRGFVRQTITSSTNSLVRQVSSMAAQLSCECSASPLVVRRKTNEADFTAQVGWCRAPSGINDRG
ncbi:hypothetical protein CMUS01_12823 [Colletotrichum musicola]|uniref:Uncharacterized protein n=1 Tax=Colletotrichum musicola TaxID=2175873 RepID=A0A8H6JIX7_9PEZI|nr:hypothetical protein CMUS01_12823 [Colletotrichum musicola]